MKKQILFYFLFSISLFVFFSVPAFSNFKKIPVLEKGTYYCVKGNHDDICDQKIIPVIKPMTKSRRANIDHLIVYYTGDCGNQGPYRYTCDHDASTCSDANVSLKIMSKKSYLWKNLDYGFECYFSISSTSN